MSVTDGMAAATIGSDTGGSVRIPSALCGITGFKPTQARVPLAGAFPLSFTRDSIGPLGHSVTCCAWLDAVMAGINVETPEERPLTGMRLGVPRTVLLDGLAPQVAEAFARLTTVHNLVFENESRLRSALRALRDGADLADELIARGCRDHGCRHLATFDKGIIRQHKPFATLPQ